MGALGEGGTAITFHVRLQSPCRIHLETYESGPGKQKTRKLIEVVKWVHLGRWVKCTFHVITLKSHSRLHLRRYQSAAREKIPSC
jgi:hypothetical protein